MEIRIKRGKKWCREQAIETGRNYDETVDVTVSPVDLSPQARKILLLEAGRFPEYWRGKFSSDYRFCLDADYGEMPPCIDADSPTAQEVSDAIEASEKALRKKRDFLTVYR